MRCLRASGLLADSVSCARIPGEPWGDFQLVMSQAERIGKSGNFSTTSQKHMKKWRDSLTKDLKDQPFPENNGLHRTCVLLRIYNYTYIIIYIIIYNIIYNVIYNIIYGLLSCMEEKG